MYAAAEHSENPFDSESDDDTIQPPTKKQCMIASRSYRPARILTRRYALTATAFKHVEIGITVGMDPGVDVILGDNRGTQLKMSYSMWRKLLDRREHVQGLLDKTRPADWRTSPVRIRDIVVDETDKLLGTRKCENADYKYLFIEVCAINGSDVFKVTVGYDYLFLKPSTMDFLFNLEHCIRHARSCLNFKEWDTVARKVKNYVTLVKEKNITTACDAAKAIRESETYDAKSAVDCELMAYAIPDIVYIANYKDCK